MREYNLIGTTDASGDAVVDVAISGVQLLHAIKWVDGDMVDGVDGVLSCVDSAGFETTLVTLTNANVDAWYYPSTVEQDTSGADRATTTRMVVSGTLRLTIAQGGATKTGGAYAYTVEA